MNLTDFTLLGHDSPLGRYPGPVIPIGTVGSRRHIVALYTGDNETDAVRLPEGSLFYRHRSCLFWDDNGRYTPDHSLFAFSPDVVLAYGPTHERGLYSLLLSRPSFFSADPFFRLSLAQRTRSSDIAVREISRCVAHLAVAERAIVDDWYRATYQSLTLLPFMAKSLPTNWQPLALRGREFDAGVEGPRTVVLALPGQESARRAEALCAELTRVGLDVASPSWPSSGNWRMFLELTWPSDTVLLVDQTPFVFVLDYNHGQSSLLSVREALVRELRPQYYNLNEGIRWFCSDPSNPNLGLFAKCRACLLTDLIIDPSLGMAVQPEWWSGASLRDDLYVSESDFQNIVRDSYLSGKSPNRAPERTDGSASRTPYIWAHRRYLRGRRLTVCIIVAVLLLLFLQVWALYYESEHVLHGRVIDRSASPIFGAKVRIRGTQVTTDLEGRFTIHFRLRSSEQAVPVSIEYNNSILTSDMPLTGEVDIMIAREPHP